MNKITVVIFALILQTQYVWGFGKDAKIEDEILRLRQELHYTKEELAIVKKDAEKRETKLNNDIENLKKMVFEVNDYFNGCSFSNEWSNCKMLTDVDNKRTILAIPRNGHEILGIAN